MRAELRVALKRLPKRYRLRVRERLVILEYATTCGIKPAAARFGLKRRARPVSASLRVRKGSDQLRSPDLTRLDFKVKVSRCTAATAGLS